MKKLIFILFININSFVIGQIGVGTKTPSESAMVDLIATDKGFSGAHIPLVSITDKKTILDPTDGLLVYNTSTTNDLQPGYYTWIIDKWVAAKPTLDLEVTTNGKLIDYLGYEPSGAAPTSLTNFTSDGITFTALGCKKWSENNHSYCAYKGSAPFDWQQAFNAAKSQNGYMVTFTSLAEWNWAKTNIIDNSTGYNLSSSIWIGYNKVNYSGNPTEFTWITGEKSKTNWETLTTEHNFRKNTTDPSKNEPNNDGGNEGCVHIIRTSDSSTREWNDRNCDYKNSNQWPGPWEHLIIEFDK